MDVPERTTQKEFSSTISIGSDEDLKVYCQPCDQDGPRLPAYGYCTNCKEHLCETCFKFHKKHTLSRHHTLLDKDIMPQTLSSASVQPSQPDDLNKRCPKHKKEIIKFYCNDHKALLCNVCVTLEHTVTSCKVKYIPDISSAIVNSKEYDELLRDIDSISDQCHNLSEDVKIMTVKSNISVTDVLSDIKKFRKEINQKLDELEKQAEDAAKASHEDNNKKLKTVETTCNDITKSLKTISDSIKHLNTSKQGDELFVELKLAEEMIKDFEKRIHQLTVYCVAEYIFKPSKSLSELLEEQKSLGVLTQKTLKDICSPQNTDMKSRQISHQEEICASTPKDGSRCWITGMALLTPDCLIITDWNNKAVKMVNISSQYVADHLQLDSSPWDITLVTDNELAVTIPDKRVIQFVSASSNILSLKQTLKVDGKCSGLSCYKDKFVVSLLNPAKLQILTTKGTKLSTVINDNIFNRPVYVKTNSSSIYVSDRIMKTFTVLNWQGEMTGICTDLGKLSGLALSDDETVFVCCNENNVIQEIMSDGSGGKVVLKVNHPHAVSWCADNRKLYCSIASGINKYDNFIHIFKLP